MNLQSKINLIKSRIKQIRHSDLFTDKEKYTLIKTNTQQLEMYQTQKLHLCIESTSQALETALKLPSSMNVESKTASV